MSLRRLTDAEAADLQEHAHRLEELAEELRCRAVNFRAVQDTAIVETSRALREVAGLVSEIVEGLPA